MTQKLLPSSTTTMEMSNDTSDDSDSSNTSTTTLAAMDDSNESDSSDGVVTTTSADADDADVFDLTYFEVTPKGDLALKKESWDLSLFCCLLIVLCCYISYIHVFFGRMVIYLRKKPLAAWRDTHLTQQYQVPTTSVFQKAAWWVGAFRRIPWETHFSPGGRLFFGENSGGSQSVFLMLSSWWFRNPARKSPGMVLKPVVNNG